jgi:hypothetical protein
MFAILKSPENLLELAYKKSFGSANYGNAFKYAVEPRRFYQEIALKEIAPVLKSKFDDKLHEIKRKLNEFIDSAISEQCLRQLNAENTHDFIDQLACVMQNFYFFSDILVKSKNSVVKTAITNVDSFKYAFKHTIEREREAIMEKVVSEFLFKFKKQLFNEVRDKLKYFIGCESVCPCCGSKCCLENNHEGNHKSTKHVFESFHGWRFNKTNLVVTHICWELFLNGVISKGEHFETCKEYLAKFHSRWIGDLEDNYNVYIKQKNDGFKKYEIEVIRIWMNTRKALIAKYQIVDRDKYDAQWLEFEDRERMLPIDFEPSWEENNIF